ncbi:hypothetical protein MMC13_005297 [Lambiella insularis]|nr:hypothetical protein [Lambiella insularis]
MDMKARNTVGITEPQTPSRKRRRPTVASSTHESLIDLTTNDEDEAIITNSKKRKTASPRKGKDEEKRLRVFRKQPPQSYLEKLSRAQSQRMFVVDRVRQGTEEIPEEIIELAGSTGNIYQINIKQVPTCSCPDFMKGNQCKHIVYVLHYCLKAPEHLQYQLAFLSSELREIFAQAPLPPSSQSSTTKADPNRKPVEGDCPICFTEMEEEKDDLVFCQAKCGNNLHKECLEQWANSRAGKPTTCVYCRTPWQADEGVIKRVKTTGKVNDEGYVNVAAELGLSGTRDYSTYHQPWVRQRFGYF